MIKKTWFNKIAGLSLVLCLCVQLSMQAQSQEFRHISIRDGLPSGYIHTITQDNKGFIWFGTNAGIGKYDGYSIKAYRFNPDDNTAISGRSVYDIIEYDEHTFFVATNGGLNIFNPATEVFHPFTVPDSLPSPQSVRDLLLINEHSMWIGADTGLFNVDPATLMDENPDIKFYELPGLQQDQSANITVLATDFVKSLWVGTDSSLYKFDLESNTFTDLEAVGSDADDIIQGAIRSMVYTSGNDLIIASNTGLAILREGECVIEEVKQLGEYNREGLRLASFQSITEGSDNNIWLGTELMGAIKWNPETGDVLPFRASGTSQKTVSSDDVRYAFEDDNGNVWFGYLYAGASIMYDDSWNYETHVPFPDLPSSDPRNTITNSKIDENGMLWATTTNGLIRDLEGENQQFFLFDHSAYESIDQNQRILYIYAIHDNKIYLGSQAGFQTGYIVFDREGGDFSVLQVPNELNVTPGTGTRLGDQFFNGIFNVNSITKTDLNSGEIEVINIPVQGEYPGTTVSISVPFFIHENDLFVQVYFSGVPGGDQVERFIMNLETGEFRTHDIIVDFPILNTHAPLVSPNEPGVMYINVRDGLIRVDHLNNSYTVLFEDQISLIREGSLLMVADQDGYIWLNNFTGLTRLDPLTEEIDYFEVPLDQYVAVFAFPAALSNGEIIFPGIGSYIRFNPADLRSTQPVGETLITSLRAGSKTFELVYSSEKPEIENNQNTLTFNFIGLDLRNPGSIHYRYRILGSENEQWTEIGTQRSVFIPNLRAGDYTFEVQSGSQVGTFSGQTAVLEFTILPPWWNTVPAYIMYLLLFGGFVFGVDRVQRKRLIQKERERAREKELEQAKEIEKAYQNLEEAHNRLATAHNNLKAAQDQLIQQEKLASLGQLTAGIAHEIKNPLNFVNNFSDLSIELIEEAREEVKRKTADGKRETKKSPSPKGIPSGEGGKNDEVVQGDVPGVDHELIHDILNDIETNLKTIHKHGSRADSIVKSMLQHSRGGDGKLESSPLNPIIKEYVNLAFHGMRAGKDPINVEIDLQLDEKVSKVPIIAEDFSRVILNLVNNAFDAMREKLSEKAKVKSEKSPFEGGADPESFRGEVGDDAELNYNPKLSIRTKSSANTVTIEIEDNGPGIPDEMKDKIMQPFFTTKKGTEGTGLGLSITNDIVKAHGGEMKINSIPEKGTTFSIILTAN